MDYTFDSMYYDRGELIGGIDEAGVSDLAGPMVAACVILPKILDVRNHDLKILEINDSKKIPEKYRSQHAEVVWNTAIAIGIGEVSASEIDIIGQRSAQSLAMLRAIMACRKISSKKLISPDFLLIDGDIDVPTVLPKETVIGGDGKSLSIAAASLIAKVYRDSAMKELHELHPHYCWASNKGFPCDQHFAGLDKHGIVPGIHRMRIWPLSDNASKSADERKAWRNRRKQWCLKTEAGLYTAEHGGDKKWISSKNSSRHLTRLKQLLTKTT